jgi:hypothetical protein
MRRAMAREVAYLSDRLNELALSGDPVDQACGIQQRCCFIQEIKPSIVCKIGFRSVATSV